MDGTENIQPENQQSSSKNEAPVSGSQEKPIELAYGNSQTPDASSALSQEANAAPGDTSKTNIAAAAPAQNIYSLFNQAKAQPSESPVNPQAYAPRPGQDATQAPSAPFAPDARLARGAEQPMLAQSEKLKQVDWKDEATFKNNDPRTMVNSAGDAFAKGDYDTCFQDLKDAMTRVNRLDTNVLLTDLANYRAQLDKMVKLPPDQVTKNTQQMHDLSTKILQADQIQKTRSEVPLSLAFAMLTRDARNGQVPDDSSNAWTLIKNAALVNPTLKKALDDTSSDVSLGRDNVAKLYGDGKAPNPLFVQKFNQAVADGAAAAGQTPAPLTAFEKDPAAIEKLVEAAHQKMLETKDPAVHEQEADTLAKTKSALSPDVQLEHKRAIEYAKDAKNKNGESYNSVLVEVTSAKNALAAKTKELADCKDQLTKLQQKSKDAVEQLVKLQAEKKDRDGQWKVDIFDWRLGGTSKVESTSKDGELNAEQQYVNVIARKLKQMDDRRKALEGDPKAGSLQAQKGEIALAKDDLSAKKDKLADVGKAITDSHMKFAKTLLLEAQRLAQSPSQTKDEAAAKVQLLVADVTTAAIETKNAEKINSKLAEDPDLKQRKNDFHFITSTISDSVNTSDAHRKELDDSFISTITQYNQLRDEKAEAGQPKGQGTELQAGTVGELDKLAMAFPELQNDAKFLTARGLVIKGTYITDDLINKESAIVSKALEVNDQANKVELAKQKFAQLLGTKQYKDAETQYQTLIQNLKPHSDRMLEELDKTKAKLASDETSIYDLDMLRQKKDALETETAKTNVNVLQRLGALYLSDGKDCKPELAIKALDEAKKQFPGIDKNPLYQEEYKYATDTLKDVRQLEINAAERGEKLKDAGIDLTTSLAGWGGGAVAGTVVGGIVLAAGAPITVPAALIIGGSMLVGGAVTGGFTKWGLANAFHSKDTDFGHTFGSGALTGGASGGIGGGLKVGGLIVADGLAFGGATYGAVNLAKVSEHLSKFVPLVKDVEQSTVAASRLKVVAGDHAAEMKVGEEILQEHLAGGRITQAQFDGAKTWLSTANPGETAEILETAGIPMTHIVTVPTAAGASFATLTAGTKGWKTVDASYKVLSENLPNYKLHQVIGNYKNISALTKYAFPHLATKAAITTTAMAVGSGYYNTGKYAPEYVSGEAGAFETAQKIFDNTTSDTINGSLAFGGVSAGGKVLGKVAGMVPSVIAGYIDPTFGQIGKSGLGAALGAKIQSYGPVAFTQTLVQDTIPYSLKNGPQAIRSFVPSAITPFSQYQGVIEKANETDYNLEYVKSPPRNYELRPQPEAKQAGAPKPVAPPVGQVAPQAKAEAKAPSESSGSANSGGDPSGSGSDEPEAEGLRLQGASPNPDSLSGHVSNSPTPAESQQDQSTAAPQGQPQQSNPPAQATNPGNDEPQAR